MKKILFSHSYYYQLDGKQWKTGMPYPPLATITVASFMREKGYDVQLYDVGLKQSPKSIKPILEAGNFDFLVIYDDGFNYLTKMCLTVMREACFEMINLAKTSNCKIIISSSDSTDHYQKYLQKGADVILLGEGEISLLETVQAFQNGIELKDISGICYKKDGEIIKNKNRPVVKDLDEFPLPAWDLINVDAYKQAWTNKYHPFALNIATTRGCPYKCNWCAKPIYGNRYNSRSPEMVCKEIEYLITHYNVTNFWMCDDIFGLKPNWVNAFNCALEELNLKITYKIQSRADLLLKEDNITVLAKSGLKEVWIGAESGSQKILDAMDKGTKVDQIKHATKLLQSQGIRVAFFIQYGYLGETKEDISKTIQLIKTCNPDDIGISVSYPLPGTKFYNTVKNELVNKQNWEDSDDLAMMFKGTFNQNYYRKLHAYTHKTFQSSKGFLAVKQFFAKPITKSRIKLIIKAPFQMLLASIYKLQLNTMSNKNGE